MKTISSVHDLQMLMPRLLEKHGTDTKLAYLALANPLVALEKLGYSITDDAKVDLENYARFGKKGLDKYNQLKEEIFSLSGKKFNLKNVNETALVFDKLIKNKEKANPAAQKKSADSMNIKKLILTPPKQLNNKFTDELKKAKEVHPAILPLLELRKLEASVPRFADAETLAVIQKNKAKTPFTYIHFRLSRK